MRTGESSKCICMNGAAVETISKEAEAVAIGMIVIQGRGNGMTERGEDTSVKTVLDGVRNIKGRNKRMRVTVASVLPGPGMEKNRQYERTRQSVNKNLQSNYGNES